MANREASHSHRYSRRQALGLIGSGVLAGCAVNPVTGERQLLLVSRDQEIRIGRQQAPHQFSADLGPVQDSSLNNYISELGRQMAAVSHRPDMPYSFRAVNATYLNAYAFPDGSIAVTRGMLVELENEAELAALLGHEVGHVAARHTAQRMTQQTLSGLVMAGVGQVVAQRAPDYTGLARDLGGLASGALLAHYSRDDERQADELGLEYMIKAGQNPRGMVGLMDVLRSQHQRQPNILELMFSTHPMGSERYQTAVNRVQALREDLRERPLNRETYMDATASLRAIKPAIEKLQAANAAMAQEKVNEAQRLAREAVKLAPRDYGARITLGTTLLASEQFDAGLTAFREGLDLYPDQPRGHQLAGVTLLQMKRPEEALEHFRRYQRILPGNPGMLFLTGYAHEQAGQRQQAAELYYQYLQQVQQGEQAQYARQRLAEWGVIPAQ